MIAFEWNEAKSRSNLSKHGVSFTDAKSVLIDEYAVQFFGEEHSTEEDRIILLGLSNQSRVLVVCHCERSDDQVIRIISARKATKKESGCYPKGTL